MQFIDRLLRGRPSYLVPAAAASCIGVLLIGLSIDRVLAASYLLPVTGTLWKLDEGGEGISDEEFARANISLSQALAQDPASPDLYDKYGSLLLAWADLAQQDEALKTARFDLAADALSHAVARAPQNSAIWARLAYATMRAEGFSEMALNALRMSYFSGRLDFRVMPLRLSISLKHWDALPSAYQREAAWQLATMWQYRSAQSALFLLYLNLGNSERALLRKLLPASAETLPEFDHRLEVWLKRRAPTDIRERYLR